MLLSCWGLWQKILWCTFCACVCASNYYSICKYFMYKGMQQLKRTIFYKTRTAQVINQQETETKWEYFVVAHQENRKWTFNCKRSCDFFLSAPYWSQTSLPAPINLGSAPLTDGSCAGSGHSPFLPSVLCCWGWCQHAQCLCFMSEQNNTEIF